MKKQNLLLMCFSMLLGLAACGGNTSTSSSSIPGSNIQTSSSKTNSSSVEVSTSNNSSSGNHLTMEDKEKRENGNRIKRGEIKGFFEPSSFPLLPLSF